MCNPPKYMLNEMHNNLIIQYLRINNKVLINIWKMVFAIFKINVNIIFFYIYIIQLDYIRTQIPNIIASSYQAYNENYI